MIHNVSVAETYVWRICAPVWELLTSVRCDRNRFLGFQNRICSSEPLCNVCVAEIYVSRICTGIVPLEFFPKKYVSMRQCTYVCVYIYIYNVGTSSVCMCKCMVESHNRLMVYVSM